MADNWKDELKNLAMMVIGGVFSTAITLYFLGKDSKVFSPVIDKIKKGQTITRKEQQDAAVAVRKSKDVAKHKDGMDEDTLERYDELEAYILNYENVAV
jgi:hypothetical protein